MNAHGARIAGQALSRDTPLTNHRAVSIPAGAGRLARCVFCDLRWPWGATPTDPRCVTRPWTDR